MAGRFYEQLAGLGEIGQFPIGVPHADALVLAKVQLLTGEPDDGRYGLFPVRATRPATEAVP